MLSKEEILEALAGWNYWDKPLPETIILKPGLL